MLKTTVKLKCMQVGAVLAGAAIVLSGCSSGGSDRSNVDPAARSAAVEKAKGGATQLLDAGKLPNKWTGPESSPKPRPGIKLTIIPEQMASTGSSRAADAIQEEATKLGWVPKISDGQGKPDVQLNALNAAVDEKADAVILVFVDTTRVQSALQRALAAALPHGVLGMLQMKNTDLYITVNGQYKGSQDYLEQEANCPGCVVVTKDWSLASFEDPTTGPAAQAVATLQSDPSLNWVSCFDSCLFRVTNGLNRAGLADRVSGAGFDCNPENLADIRSGGSQKVCFADPREWLAFAAMDNINRMTNGQPAVDYTKALPVALFDKESLDSLPADQSKQLETDGWQGNFDFRTKFEQLWGLSPSSR